LHKVKDIERESVLVKPDQIRDADTSRIIKKEKNKQRKYGGGMELRKGQLIGKRTPKTSELEGLALIGLFGASK